MTIRTTFIVLILAATLSACASEVRQPDAYGNVEAVTVTVAAQAAGQVTSLDVTEGQTLGAGQVVGTIEPKPLSLERDQLVAQQNAARSRESELDRQVEVLTAQRAAVDAQRGAAGAQRAALDVTREIAQRNYDRTVRLFDQKAATAQQRDQAERELKTTEQQLRAQEEQIRALERQMEGVSAQIAAARAQRTTAERQTASAAAQVARVAERLEKTSITNTAEGTVLETYARAGEVVQIGQPLYSIANLARVDVRAYLSQMQLASVRLGQTVTVTFDQGDSRQSVQGQVSWISSQAEFTPTPVQTRDERTDLVYAFKVSVPNEQGRMKIGMPVDVTVAAVGAQ